MSTPLLGLVDEKLEGDALRQMKIRSKEVLKMQKVVDKKWITSETVVTGELPSIEGDPRKLERMVANSVSHAITPDQGEGKASGAAGAEFRKSPAGEAIGRKGKQAPARTKQTLEFISFLTHELKTPLTSIQASAGLLAEELALSPDDPKARLISNILASASNLEARMSELLSLAKLEKEPTGADERAPNHESQIPDSEFQNQIKILVIENNPQIVEAISLCFELRCPEMSVVSATNGNTGIEMVETESPDMVIVDLGLPDIDGFDVLREIRSFSDVPAIILSIRAGEMDKVRGLELGADDYMVKPFNHAELLARVKAVLRRTTMPQLKDAEEVLISSELKIDFASSCLYRKGQTVKLTLNESNLLYHLVRNGGKTLSRRYLLERIWGEEHSDATEYLKVYVQRLRKKLEDDPSQPKMLTTERGLGYRFIKPIQKTPANRSPRAKALLRRKEAVGSRV
ncbi:MAG: response regulator [Dehalococcoidia bacterium]|nr:response regulator [Dehalococcoidia bacterium]